jgi:isobutylamine N-monooxygenase
MGGSFLSLLARAHRELDNFHPGLRSELRRLPLAVLESRGSPILKFFREFDGPALMVPEKDGGAGAGTLEGFQVVVGLSSLSPSLAVAAANHHFTVAQLYAIHGPSGRLESSIMELIADLPRSRALIASGWAESTTNRNTLTPAATSVPDGDVLVVSGTKNPCSMAHSMGILTASLTVSDAAGNPATALAVVPSSMPGISASTTWTSELLAAAENDEVRLDRVRIPRRNVILNTPDDPGLVEDLLSAGFIWYELLITAAYAGAALRVVDEALMNGWGSVSARAELVVTVRPAVALLEGLARRIDLEPEFSSDLINDVLVARYSAQRAFAAATDHALEQIGGTRFARSPEFSYLVAACRLLPFHTPARAKMEQSLTDYAMGEPFKLA